MRFPFLVLLLAILFCAPAFAEDAPRGVLPSGKTDDVLKDAKPEQIEEALRISAQCRDTDYLRTYYDCDCLGMKFLELRKERGDVVSETILLIEAERSCPNSVDVAGRTFDQCK
ncbi:MAG TPA: hypothetical protein PKH37_07725, partial [Alphaproteobacteria bacterium]|nr:hypothetical protein [Alphaproteobacteria bacterium]